MRYQASPPTDITPEMSVRDLLTLFWYEEHARATDDDNDNTDNTDTNVNGSSTNSTNGTDYECGRDYEMLKYFRGDRNE